MRQCLRHNFWVFVTLSFLTIIFLFAKATNVPMLFLAGLLKTFSLFKALFSIFISQGNHCVFSAKNIE